MKKKKQNTSFDKNFAHFDIDKDLLKTITSCWSSLCRDLIRISVAISEENALLKQQIVDLEDKVKKK